MQNGNWGNFYQLYRKRIIEGYFFISRRIGGMVSEMITADTLHIFIIISGQDTIRGIL